MKYFRHFSDAGSSIKLQNLTAELGLVGEARYWRLLALLNSKFDGTTTCIEVHYKELATTLETRSKQSTINFIMALHRLSILSLIGIEVVTNESLSYDNLLTSDYSKLTKQSSLYLDCPILLQLMDKDSKYNRKRVPSESLDAKPIREKKIEIKEEDKELDKEKEKICTERPGPSLPLKKSHESFQDDLLNPYLDQVPLASQEAWIKTYQDIAFIKIELMKAVTWIANNPTRSPKKNYGNFFSNWLSRGWESHRKSIKSNGPKTNHYEKLRDENPWRKDAQGEVVNG